MDEKDQIRLAGQGDEQAFESLVIAYQKPIYNLCYRMVRDQDEAFDLTQETFIKAWHAIALFQGDSKFITWISRIAANTCLDFLRKKKREKTVNMSALEDEERPLEALIADTSQDPAYLAELSENRKLVWEAFSKLPQQDRMILSLWAVKGLSYQEIGQVMELKDGTVKSRIARAREKIRQNLGENLPAGISDKKKGIKEQVYFLLLLLIYLQG